ncbi:IPT/TIG domain-containing protein [Chitinophaga horti]|uniref:IPT/TIG domain-containing protein n=1 Tax=Chitinophaga horti TaxID=2920382 RepID=A0ABY6J0F3_9BACT|nr:IPT/TIG domain-containing protein [Chitinophaga horti]UYQ92122.1 IPT/TIG domain-containing protein [Chitinophaga horti]
MRKIFLFSILANVLLLGCSKEELGHNASQPMTITSFTPGEGDGGTSILITGTNFSSDTSEIEVTINGNRLVLTGANTEQIMAVVPKKCGSGPVTVKIGSNTVTSTATYNYIFTRTVSTLAGAAAAGYNNGKGDLALFNFSGATWYRSLGISIDDNLNIYVADPGNHCIRKIDPDGNVTLLAGKPTASGYADGRGSDAMFSLPYSTAVDEEGNVYVADPGNWDIRKISPDGTAVTLGWGTQAPWAVAYDRTTKSVYYISCDFNGTVYKLENGNSTPVISGLVYPCGMAFDNKGSLFISGHGTSVVYRYNTTTWKGEVIAGKENEAGYINGPGPTARFAYPWGLAVDNQGNIYVAGNGTTDGLASNADQSIRFIEANTWKVSTLAGGSTQGYVNGIGEVASFSAPTGVGVDKNGVVYVIDKHNNRVRKIISE